MKRNKLRLIFLLVLVSWGGYFFLRTPKYKDLSELPVLFNANHHFVPLKISRFSSANIPQTDIQVEDKIISSKVDLGFYGGLTLPKGMIETLKNKSFIERTAFFGVRGRTYESNVYELPQIRIGKFKVFPMRVEEKSDEFENDGKLIKEKQKISEEHLGCLGWRVFKPFNLFLDCNHSLLAVCDSLDTLKKQGYSVDSFIEAPLLLDHNTIDFEVMTEAGPLRCVLDTGCTLNMLNRDFDSQSQDHMLIDMKQACLNGKSPEFNPQNEDLLVYNLEDDWEANQFEINGTDFGPINFVKMKSPMGLDAFIGMEFIENHLIFIDFYNEKIYFSKLPEERSLFTRACDFIETGIKKFW